MRQNGGTEIFTRVTPEGRLAPVGEPGGDRFPILEPPSEEDMIIRVSDASRKARGRGIFVSMPEIRHGTRGAA